MLTGEIRREPNCSAPEKGESVWEELGVQPGDAGGAGGVAAGKRGSLGYGGALLTSVHCNHLLCIPQ